MILSAQLAQRLIIYGTALLSVMGVAVILPVLPDMAHAFQIDDAELGMLVYSFTLPGIAFAPIWGILADRWGRKRVLVLCLMLFALGGFCASFTSSLSFLLFWRVVQGIGAASLGVLFSTLVGDIYQDTKLRLKVMGYAATTLSLGAAIFPALGGLLGELGWQWTLRLSLLAVPLCALVLYTPVPKHVRHTNATKYFQEVKHIVLSRKSLLHFAITFCAFCILYGPLISFFPLLSDTYYKANPAKIGMIFALSSLGTVGATLFLGTLIKKFSTQIMARYGALFFILSMTVLIFWSKNLPYWLLTFPILLYGIGQGLLYTITMSSLTALAPSSGRGALMAVNGTVLRLAQSLSPYLCGLIFVHQAFDAVFFFGLCIAIVMFLCSLYAFSKANA